MATCRSLRTPTDSGEEAKIITTLNKKFDGNRAIPLAHYGLRGVNRFELYENCICLNSFYTHPNALSDAIQYATPQADRIDVEVVSLKNSRTVSIHEKYRYTRVKRLARGYLQMLELDPVIQAIGRVRPFTRPRRVIVSQMNDLSALGPVKEVRSYKEILEIFGVQDIFKKKIEDRNKTVHGLRSKGMTIREIAATTGMSKSNIGRIIRDGCPASRNINIIRDFGTRKDRQS